MSVVFGHVGGCGVGIARSFWDLCSDDHAMSHRSAISTHSSNNADDGALASPSPFFGTVKAESNPVDDGKSPPLASSARVARCVAIDSDRARLAWLVHELADAPRLSKSSRKERSLVRAESVVSPAGVEKYKGTFDAIAAQQRKGGLYSRHNTHDTAPSRGGNWALGYYGSGGAEGKEGSLSVAAVQSIRKEAERCDSYSGTVLMHSAVGGCGSGLSCRVVELLREEFPKLFLVSLVVTPFTGAAGGSPLGHYNTSLCLSRLNASVDTVVILRNSDAQAALVSSSVAAAAMSSSSTATARPAPGGQQSSSGSVSFGDLNRYWSCVLSDLFSPLSTLESYQTATRATNAKLFPFGSKSVPRASPMSGFELHDFVAAVSPVPSNKFVEIYSTSVSKLAASASGNGSFADLRQRRRFKGGAGTSATWSSLSSSLCRRMGAERVDCVQGRSPWLPHGYTPATLYAQAIGRGDSDDSLAERHYTAVQKALCSSLRPVTWNPFPLDIRVTRRPSVAGSLVSGVGRTLSICANRSRVVEYLSETAYKARQMLQARAYLHWIAWQYERLGCSSEELNSSFDVMDDIVQSYTHAAKA